MSDECAIEARRGYLELGGTRLSYLDWAGAGPPALLLHGITSSAATLWRAAPALAAAGRRVIALDMPGHGESAVSPAHTIDAIAGLAGDAIGALGLREVGLIGHSWGGATALALASGEHAARAALASVVLVDPLLALGRERGERLLPDYAAGVGQPAAELLPDLRARNPDWHPCDVGWKAAALEQCRRAQVEGLFRPAADWSLLDRLPQVAAPLLLLVADPAYSIIPADALATVREQLPPGGRVVVVPGVTHNMLRGAGYQPTIGLIQSWLSG